MISPVTRLSHVALRSPDVERLRSYYTDVIGLAPYDDANGAVFLASGGYGPALELRPGDTPGLDHVGFGLFNLGCACNNTTFHGRSFRREALCASYNRFELSTRTKCRDGRRLYLHGLAGTRIAGYTRRAAALLEHTEPGNRDAVALVYRTHNGVNDILDGGGRLPTVRAQFLCEHVNELCFVHPTLRS